VNGREPNPAAKRFDWIARRYPFAVLVRTFQVWANTVGADTFVDLAGRETGRHSRGALCARGICTEEQLSHWFVEWIEKQIAVGLDPNAGTLVPYPPADSVYDRYLPWVAATINRSLKAFWKEADWVIVRMPDNFILGLDGYTAVAQATGQGDVPVLSASQHARYAFHQAAREYQDTYNALRYKLRLLVAFAEARGTDLGTIKDLLNLEIFARGAEAWAAEQQPQEDAVEGHILYRFPDGWTVQLLDNQEVLDYEGEAMHHCVADYADPHDEFTSYYSLRDPGGRPHVTVEHALQADAWPQVKGGANSVPKLEYLKRLACWRLLSHRASDAQATLRGAPFPALVFPMNEGQHRIYAALAEGPWVEWSLVGAWDDRRTGEGWLLYEGPSGEGGRLSMLPRSMLEQDVAEARRRADVEAGERGLVGRAAERHAESVFLQMLGEVGADFTGSGFVWEEDTLSPAWLLWADGVPYAGDAHIRTILKLVGHDVMVRDELVRHLLDAGIQSPHQLGC
jgi:hypothetical protein